MLHKNDDVFVNCGLYYPPDAQYEGQHEFDMGRYRKRPGEDPEQSHVVGQQAQLALILADCHQFSDMQKARMVNVDMCAGMQSQRKRLRRSQRCDDCCSQRLARDVQRDHCATRRTSASNPALLHVTFSKPIQIQNPSAAVSGSSIFRGTRANFLRKTACPTAQFPRSQQYV